ncbi:MAG: hypothetical protein E7672_09220 [Ruminococcaceae bacterium]|nr:hypothetical protein [Oscillospiraceae bacterium]
MIEIDLRSPSFAEIIEEHAARYPKMQPRDLVKLAFQAEFGPGHMISDENAAIQFLRNEMSSAQTSSSPHIENLGEKYSRIYLKQIEGFSNEGLTSLYSRLFLYSAKDKNGNIDGFLNRIDEIREIVSRGTFSFQITEFDRYIEEYISNGINPVSHSSEYRNAYSPAYRVVKRELASLLPLILLLKKKESAIIAIDGFCGSGKSTIAAILADLLDANLIHTDDFFLPSSKRKPERYAEPGGNIDYERFYDEVVCNIHNDMFSHGVFDCSAMQITSAKTYFKKKFTIIEGAYSLHPYFKDYYDVSIFVQTSETEQRKRIIARDGIEYLKMFEDKWIPLEKHYEASFKIRKQVEFLINT